MTELALRANTTTRDWVELMAPAVELAKQVADTTFVPTGLRNNPPAIVAAILYGDEVGLGPMQALAKIAVINGRPTLAAEAQRALILAAGHEIWIVEANTTRVTVAGRRRNSEQTSTVTWTMDDAKRAGLAGKTPYKLYPRQMLSARATAELARLVFADAIGGLYATEELEEGGFDENGETVEPKPATTKRRRERVNQTAGETSGTPPSAPAPERPPLPHELPANESTATVPVAEEASFEDMHTQAQLKKLNVLVGRLRDAGHLQTIHVWSAVAQMRALDTEMMIGLLGGRDEDDVLHWSPLRDTLTKDEASSLIDRLERYEGNVGGAEL